MDTFLYILPKDFTVVTMGHGKREKGLGVLCLEMEAPPKMFDSYGDFLSVLL